MSATVYWEPAKRPRKSLPTMAPQMLIRSLRALGVELGCELNEEHVPALRALAQVVVEKPNPYHALADAVEKHGAIVIYAEY